MERFYSKVSPCANTGCHLWDGARIANRGYGKLKVGSKYLLAHRVAYEIENGEIPEGMHVCHKCDNPSCVNPDHLFVGTHSDNMQDKIRKGRDVSGQAMKTHCPSGHEYNQINTHVDKNGHRHCRVCDRNRKKDKAHASKK